MTGQRDHDLTGATLPEPPDSDGQSHGPPPVQQSKSEKGRRLGRSWPARIALAFFSLLLMVALGIGALFAVLTRGPIEIGFLSERVAVGLEERLGAGIDVDVGRTVLEKDSRGLSLHILDVVLKDSKGREFLRSPDAVVGFSPLQLLGLKISPERLALRGVSVRAEVTTEGELFFRTSGQSFSQNNATTSATAPGRDVAAFFFGLGDQSTGGLSSLSIEEASLTIDDRRNGKQVSFQNFTLNVTSPRERVVQASGSLTKERDFVPFTVSSQPTETGRVITAQLNGLGDDTLQALIGSRQRHFTTDLRVTLDGTLKLDVNGTLESTAFTVKTSSGRLTVPVLDSQPFLVDQAAISSKWTRSNPQESFVSMDFAGGDTKFSLAGPMLLPAESHGPLRWNATGADWTLAPLSPQDQPVTATRADLTAVFDKSNRSITVERLTVMGPATRISLSGKLAKDGDSASLKASLDASAMPARTALRWWPFFVSPPARRFLVDTVRSGDLQRLKIELDMPGPVLASALASQACPREALALEVMAENVSMVLTSGLPPISGMLVQGKVDMVSSQGTVSRGFVDVKQGRRIPLSDGSFTLNRLDTWTPDGQFRFKATGALDTLADFLKSPTMQGAFALDVDPANVKGQFEGIASIRLPLASSLKTSDIQTEIEGRMTAVTVDKAIGKDKLENATLTVSTDRTGIEIKGEGRWQGTPVTLSLEKDAADGSLATVMSFTLDDSGLRRRGFNLGTQLTGPLSVKIKTSRDQGESMKAGIEIDLTRAVIDGLLPGFQKPAGRPGRLSFDAIEKLGGYTLQNIAIDSGSTSVRGAAESQSDGTVTSARFSLFRLSPGDNVKLDFDRSNTGGKVVIRGNNLDVRPFLRQANQTDRSRSPPPDRELELDLKTTLLSGYGGEVITGADAKLLLRGGQLRQISLMGKLNGKPLSITGRGSDSATPVTIETDDGGALLRYFDLYSRMVGGELLGQLNVTPRRITGYFQSKDFTLRNEPAIRRLVTETANDQSRAVNTDAKFTKVRVDFVREGSETTIKDAAIFGPQLGLTFNGIVDNQRDRISLSGTYIPAFGLNNAFAQIPLLGSLLAGGRNEGLLAVTFGVSGRASQPNVTVNPLSAVAPGIFRKMFEFRNETTNATQPASQRNPSPN